MCGIALTLVSSSCCKHSVEEITENHQLDKSNESQAFEDALLKMLARRGPDISSKYVTKVINGDVGSPTNKNDESSSNEILELKLFSSVLNLRGGKYPTKQPLIIEDDITSDLFAFCWNGECYEYNLDESCSHEISLLGKSIHFENEFNDTEIMLRLLIESCKEVDGENKLSKLGKALGRVRGEYAFILYHRTKCSECIFYGRDPLGRRSLVSYANDNNFVVSSVPCNMNFEEVATGQIFCKNLLSGSVNSVKIKMNIELPSPTLYELKGFQHASSNRTIQAAAIRLQKVLVEAIRRRVVNVPEPSAGNASVGILFSGGLDSAVMAALCDNHVPPKQPIDLINVAFYNNNSSDASSCPDRLAALVSYEELQQNYPKRDWRLIAVDIDYNEVLLNEPHILSLIAPLNTTMAFNVGAAFWFASRGRGSLIEITKNCKDQVVTSSCFPQKKKTVCSMRNCEKWAFEGCIFEACKHCCKRYQRPINKYLGAAAKICYIHNHNGTIPGSNKPVLQPRQALLRQSHQGVTVGISPNKIAYKNPQKIATAARVLLCGIGADEYMAGYGRHRSAFKIGGYEKLKKELRMEQDRLWTRNLGRDDRCISDHGREVRFPFLDENVIHFLKNLDIEEICDFTKAEGEGDKMILRVLANNINMKQCSCLVKRAIQFGSRIAKTCNVHKFGSNRRTSGTAIYKI